LYRDFLNSIFGKNDKTIDHFSRGLMGGVCKFIFEESVVVKAERLTEPLKVKFTIKTLKNVAFIRHFR
jgi:hypothetical protein